MASPFIETDLVTHISRKEWTPLSTKLVELGDPVPFASLNMEAWTELMVYTARFDVPVETLKMHWRVMVFRFGYKRLAELPKKWEEEVERSYEFLKAVRDGKFPDMLQKPVVPEGLAPQAGSWGSKPKI